MSNSLHSVCAIHSKRAVRAFTITEMLITLGLISMFAYVTLTYGIGDYERGFAKTDRLLLIDALREARAESLHGVCWSQLCTPTPTHSLYIDTKSATIIEGGQHSIHDISIVFGTPEIISSNTNHVAEVIFEAYTGRVLAAARAPITILMTGKDQAQELITINYEGGIREELRL